MRGQFTGGRNGLENGVPFAIQQACERMRAKLYREFHGRGLAITPEQWVVLVLLWERDGRTPSELSEATLRDRPTMTRILNTMERNRLVVRRRAGADARVRLINLTPAGRALRRPLTAVARRTVARIERGISQADLRVTRRTLQRIFANLAVSAGAILMG